MSATGPGRQGQAAMEYMITYGWVVIVVLVAIGALAYFGVFDPSGLVPSRCDLGSEIHCLEYRLDATAISLVLYNNLGYDIQDVNVTVSTMAPNCTDSVLVGDLGNSEKTGVLSFCGGAAFPTRLRGDLTVIYTAAGESVSHSIKGAFLLRQEG